MGKSGCTLEPRGIFLNARCWGPNLRPLNQKLSQRIHSQWQMSTKLKTGTGSSPAQKEEKVRERDRAEEKDKMGEKSGEWEAGREVAANVSPWSGGLKWQFSPGNCSTNLFIWETSTEQACAGWGG